MNERKYVQAPAAAAGILTNIIRVSFRQNAVHSLRFVNVSIQNRCSDKPKNVNYSNRQDQLQVAIKQVFVSVENFPKE